MFDTIELVGVLQGAAIGSVIALVMWAFVNAIRTSRED